MFKRYLKSERTDGQTDRHTDGQTHRQPDRRTNRHKESIGPEGRCLENFAVLLNSKLNGVAPMIANPTPANFINDNDKHPMSHS